jgi:hypothetical protein
VHSRSKNGVALLAYGTGIHVLSDLKSWMAWSSPAMTYHRASHLRRAAKDDSLRTFTETKGAQMFNPTILTIFFGATLLLLGAGDGSAASAVHGAPSSVSAPPVKTPGPNPGTPNVRGYGYGWGYGRGWCYWHPYACYRY